MAINGDEQLVAVCPQNPAHDRFLTTAHVMQEWEVEPNGEFTKVTEDCLQVTARPDQGNIWTCVECGAQAVFLTQATLESRLASVAESSAAADSAPETPG